VEGLLCRKSIQHKNNQQNQHFQQIIQTELKINCLNKETYNNLACACSTMLPICISAKDKAFYAAISSTGHCRTKIPATCHSLSKMRNISQGHLLTFKI